MSKMPFLLPDLDALDPAALKAMVCLQHAELISHKSQIEHLELLIAKLRRMQFGRSSEKVERQIEQLELKLEELEANRAELASELPAEPAVLDRSPASRKRRSLPDHLPREVHTHLPQEESCSACGGTLKKLGEDISEMLEYLPASFKVIRHVRPRMSCAATSCLPTSCTATTRRFPCLLQVLARPRPAGSGPMSATIAPPVRSMLRQSGSPTRRIARENIRNGTWHTSVASSRPTPTLASTSSMKTA